MRSTPFVHIAVVLLIGAAIGLAYYLRFGNGLHQDPSPQDPSNAGVDVASGTATEQLRVDAPESGPAAAEPSKPSTPARAPAAAVTSAAAAATTEIDEPQSSTAEKGSLSISGRVLNLRGDPISGIQINSRRFEPSTNRFSSDQQSAHSRAAGRYIINGLTAGDYQLRTTQSDRYTSATIYVRAGFRSADIVLNDGYQLRVIGTVTDAFGYPLAGVEVIPSHSGGATTTDEAGHYTTTLVIQRNRTYSFRFRAPGYAEAIQSVAGVNVVDVPETRLDVRLSAAGNSEVNGTVANEYGTVIAGAQIWMNSPSLKTSYRTRSDANGYYAISGVEAGPDYQLTASVHGLYARYIRKPIAIADGGVTLDITLSSVAGGRVVGNMVDAQGEPVPSFTLLLTSSKAAGRALPVAGDSTGYFEVDQVPTGRLTFVTRSQPRVSIRGAELTATSEVFVRLVIDWGVHNLVGQVTDISGNPLPGVNAALTWRHQTGIMTSSSSRRTLTDAAGFFRFTQLGPGVHRLDLMANGFRRHRTQIDIRGDPGELSIQLHRNS